jgi:hypothetical protein
MAHRFRGPLTLELATDASALKEIVKPSEEGIDRPYLVAYH